MSSCRREESPPSTMAFKCSVCMREPPLPAPLADVCNARRTTSGPKEMGSGPSHHPLLRGDHQQVGWGQHQPRGAGEETFFYSSPSTNTDEYTWYACSETLLQAAHSKITDSALLHVYSTLHVVQAWHRKTNVFWRRSTTETLFQYLNCWVTGWVRALASQPNY